MLYIFTTLADLKDNQSNQEPGLGDCFMWMDSRLKSGQKCLLSFASYPDLSITISLICWVESDLVRDCILGNPNDLYHSKTQFNTYFYFLQYALLRFDCTWPLIVLTWEHTPTHGSPLIENICSHTGVLSCLHTLSTKTSPKVFWEL